MDTRLRFERVAISKLVELAIRYIVIDTMAIFLVSFIGFS
jgi:hypothetical protein